MNQKILFVDDEQSLLNGLQRSLGLEYDLMTASSGVAGLVAMETQGPFAVVVTDMRMPQMDGVEFLRQAREIDPHAIYMMLTGNQDQTTASKAVNEGHVFRFLNKPCQGVDLRNALEAGLKQYRLVKGERELLHKTFCGSIGVLVEVLALTQPDVFSRASAIEDFVAALRRQLGLADRWEYKLASKLSLLGFALMPEPQRIAFESNPGFDQHSLELLNQASSIGVRLIEKIPRLGTVGRMISRQSLVDGRLLPHKPHTAEEVAITGATLLRVALQIEYLSRQGVTVEEGLRKLRSSLPCLGEELEQAIKEIWPNLSAQPTAEVELRELQAGMVLAEDMVACNGALLLRNGRRLTPTVVENLRCHSDSLQNQRKVSIYAFTDSVVGAPPAMV